MTLKKNNLKLVSLLFIIILVDSCGIYSFTGASIPAGVTTFQVNFFENKATEYAKGTLTGTWDEAF